MGGVTTCEILTTVQIMCAMPAKLKAVAREPGTKTRAPEVSCRISDRIAWYVDWGFTDAEIARILSLTMDEVQSLRGIRADAQP